MTKYLYILTLLFLASCGQKSKNSDKSQDVNKGSVSKTETDNHIKLTEKTVKFLWRVDKYDEKPMLFDMF